MIIQGTKTDLVFEQVQIRVLECNKGQECLSDAELSSEEINFTFYTKQPSLLEEDLSVHYQEVEDSTLVKSIDPRVTQKTDLFLMNSQVYLKDDMIGIFDSN